ncbi:hypothetical protein BESB_037980 [Besnoitia besnoiti]|uniref:Uncharacterized protein n=1 Tax=Besnoitia besnoiti TaxID=94643 RepID=A0A2A9MNP2_BESBE|nr:hypothetical protein BESB_037980 [Besnoitia besnoiti]PFH37340.1 hypothetical protein BESB_037980 [Besnoitia besnoiti]
MTPPRPTALAVCRQEDAGGGRTGGRVGRRGSRGMTDGAQWLASRQQPPGKSGSAVHLRPHFRKVESKTQLADAAGPSTGVAAGRAAYLRAGAAGSKRTAPQQSRAPQPTTFQ